VGRLWESFPPAQLVSGLISSNLERGFLIANLILVTFGLACWLGPVRRGRAAGIPLARTWVVIESVNAIGHPLWSLRQGGYTPGVLTAPLLGVLAWRLATLLGRQQPEALRA